MTDRTALLAAVLAAPDDDAPRLVFADWLEENGEPERAAFICCQIELARLGDNWIDFAVGPHAADYPEFEDERDWRAVTDRLAGRERELLQRHDNEWKIWCPYTARGGIDGREIECHHSPAGQMFRRGFVETVEMDADDWLAHGDAILAAHPATEVRLTTWPNIPFTRPGEAHLKVGNRFVSSCRASYGDAVTDCLRHLWPVVRTWHLPPEHRGRVIEVTREDLLNDRTGVFLRPPPPR